jgi:hypothetical protein
VVNIRHHRDVVIRKVVAERSRVNPVSLEGTRDRPQTAIFVGPGRVSDLALPRPAEQLAHASRMAPEPNPRSLDHVPAKRGILERSFRYQLEALPKDLLADEPHIRKVIRLATRACTQTRKLDQVRRQLLRRLGLGAQPGEHRAAILGTCVQIPGDHAFPRRHSAHSPPRGLPLWRVAQRAPIFIR